MIGCLPSCENKPSAPLAQSVEHLPFKQGVRGSNPRRGTKKTPPNGWCFFIFKRALRSAHQLIRHTGCAVGYMDDAAVGEALLGDGAAHDTVIGVGVDP